MLVDGLERDLDLVDTDDIASFSILTDASASAVYGVRAVSYTHLDVYKRQALYGIKERTTFGLGNASGSDSSGSIQLFSSAIRGVPTLSLIHISLLIENHWEF